MLSLSLVLNTSLNWTRESGLKVGPEAQRRLLPQASGVCLWCCEFLSRSPRHCQCTQLGFCENSWRMFGLSWPFWPPARSPQITSCSSLCRFQNILQNGKKRNHFREMQGVLETGLFALLEVLQHCGVVLLVSVELCLLLTCFVPSNSSPFMESGPLQIFSLVSQHVWNKSVENKM